jgi:hypothetical protein
MCIGRNGRHVSGERAPGGNSPEGRQALQEDHHFIDAVTDRPDDLGWRGVRAQR